MAGMYGARRPRWRYTLLDSDDQPVEELLGVEGGSLDLDAGDVLGGSAHLTFGEVREALDFRSSRCLFEYTPDGGTTWWPRGVFLFKIPGVGTDMVGRLIEDADLLSKLTIIDEDPLDARFTIGDGDQIIPAVVDLIQSTGEARIAVTESAVVMVDMLTFEVGTSKLEVVNELLRAAGYMDLWCDSTGQFRVEPYRLPEDQQVAHEFAADALSLHLPGWSMQDDESGVKNRWLAFGQGTEDDPPIVGVAENNDPRDPFSIPNIGRRTGVTSGVAAGSTPGVDDDTQEAYDLLAKRMLLASMQVSTEVSVQHAVLPLELGDTVRFSPAGLESRLLTVAAMSFDLTMAGQCSATWRRQVVLDGSVA